MRKKTIAIVSLAVIAGMCWVLTVFSSAVFVGCKALTWAVKSTRPVLIQSDNLESVPGVRVLDANNPFFKVTKRGPKRVHIEWAETKVTLKNQTCRIAQLGTGMVLVMGQLNGDKEYPTIIDTGNPMWLVVSDTVVVDSELEIYPIQEVDKDIGGLCHVSRVQIGDMAIMNPLCHYALGHYEMRVLGRTIWKQRDINMGLGLIRKFLYVLIDNITGEVEFCTEGSFEADPNESWSQYSMSIEKDEMNQERLMVDMPIAGKTRKVVFDTGSNCGLMITEKIWEKLSGNLTVLRSRGSRLGTPEGIVACRKITVEKLQVADASINNAIIFVESIDTPFGGEFFTLGMGYFQDIVIVLDFGRGLMWIKNQQSP
jgi:predicted aspartyl protease